MAKKTTTRTKRKQASRPATKKTALRSASESVEVADIAATKQVDVVQVAETTDVAQSKPREPAARRVVRRKRAKKKTVRSAAADRTDAPSDSDGDSSESSAPPAMTLVPPAFLEPPSPSGESRDADDRQGEHPEGNIAATDTSESGKPRSRSGRGPRRRSGRRRAGALPTDANRGEDADGNRAPAEREDAGGPGPTASESPSLSSSAGSDPDAKPVPARSEDQDAPAKTRRRSRPRGRARDSGRQRDADTTKPAPRATNASLRAEEPSGEDQLDEGEAQDRAAPATTRTMLINISGSDEIRIAVMHQSRLEEIFIERASAQSHVGNIYKGRIMNVEPSIQAAFIDFGLEKNGFLHISDVQPQYFPDYAGEPEEVGRKIPRRSRPAIQDCFRRGQEVIVQVIKDGLGTKGPTLSTYLSIPGRFLVMMPGMTRHGVSRKIEDEGERQVMRDMLNQLDLPTSMGFIIRTAGLGQSKRELQRDLNYLLRLWKNVVARVKTSNTPAELYQESDLVTRTIRDLYSADYDRVIVDDADAAKRAREFLHIAMPRAKTIVELYSEREPLFHRYGIEQEIENINQRHVALRSGGSLVIDSTEALVAIDVNSGRFRSPDDAEEMAFKLNLEAAPEIARQLRLRDLGGLIVCDFIDMRLERHRRGVEKALRDALKSHKERARCLRMSAFGLIEVTRQRRGPSLKRNMYFECQHCAGTGQVKMPESVVLDVMRTLQLAAHRDGIHRVEVTVSADVAYQILNRKRAVLYELETTTGKQLVVRGDPAFTSDQVDCKCEDARGQVVPFSATPSTTRGRGRRT